MTEWVRYLDPEPSPLAQMVGSAIEGNLRRRPELSRHLAKPSTCAIRVLDVGAEVSLRLGHGRVLIRNGVVGRPDVVVEADSQTLAGLSSLPLRFGLPDPRTPQGRAIVWQVASRRLRIKGLLSRPRALARLSRLLSVG